MICSFDEIFVKRATEEKLIFSFKFILIGILFRYFKSVFLKIKKHFRDNDKVRESEVDEPEKSTGPSGVIPIAVLKEESNVEILLHHI
jgi:hypothetical protein